MMFRENAQNDTLIKIDEQDKSTDVDTAAYKANVASNDGMFI